MDRELRDFYLTARETNDWSPTMTVLGEVNAIQATSKITATNTAAATELTACVDVVVVVAFAAVVAI